MIQIRKNSFETNSSSQHSIIITKENGEFTPQEMLDGIYLKKIGTKKGVWSLYCHNLDFGRSPFRILHTFQDKVCYLIASMCQTSYWTETAQKEFEEICEVVKKLCKDISAIVPDTVGERVFKDIDGNMYQQSQVSYLPSSKDEADYNYVVKSGDKKGTKVRSAGFEDKPYFGSVDHQSDTLLSRFLKEEGITYEQFLLDKKYKIVIDGDEYNELENTMNSGLINKDIIERIYE